MGSVQEISLQSILSAGDDCTESLLLDAFSVNCLSVCSLLCSSSILSGVYFCDGSLNVFPFSHLFHPFPFLSFSVCLSVSLIQFRVGIHLQPSISLADCQKTGHTGTVHVQFIHLVSTLSCSCYKYLQVQDVIETKFISLKRLDEVPVCMYVC